MFLLALESDDFSPFILEVPFGVNEDLSATPIKMIGPGSFSSVFRFRNGGLYLSPDIS
jgi:hypothetical protein